MTENNFSRRDFIKLTAVGIAVAAGANAITKVEASEGAKGEHQWAMVIDQAKCTGCDQCNLVCHAHNDINPDIQWNKVLDAGEINGKKVYLPGLVCNVNMRRVWKFARWVPPIIVMMAL